MKGEREMTKYKKKQMRAVRKKRAAIRTYEAREKMIRDAGVAAKLAMLAADRDAAYAALHVAGARLQVEIARQAEDEFERAPRPYRPRVKRRGRA